MSIEQLKNGSIFDDRFQIINCLGAGGMGTVYHAIQFPSKRDVALKLLKLDSVDQDESERFMREFQILSRLSHAHIMTFYSIGISPSNTPYAVCEYLEGKTLESVIDEDSRLDCQRSLKIALQVAEALKFAHQQDVVHRDLKPANIMLLSKPSADYVKLIDFGLARVVGESRVQKLTLTGQLLGTAHYMSPEQCTGKSVDTRSDVYAFGCVLFEMLTGEFLFDADSAVGILFKQANCDPSVRVAEMKQFIPEPLRRTILQMLQKDPKRRPASINEVIDSLSSLIHLDDTSGSTIATPKKSAKRKHSGQKTQYVFIACFVLLILIKLLYVDTHHAKTSKQWEKEHIVKHKILNHLPRDSDSLITQSKNASAGEITDRIELLKMWLERYGRDASPTVRASVYASLGDRYLELKDAKTREKYNDMVLDETAFVDGKASNSIARRLRCNALYEKILFSKERHEFLIAKQLMSTLIGLLENSEERTEAHLYLNSIVERSDLESVRSTLLLAERFFATSRTSGFSNAVNSSLAVYLADLRVMCNCPQGAEELYSYAFDTILEINRAPLMGGALKPTQGSLRENLPVVSDVKERNTLPYLICIAERVFYLDKPTSKRMIATTVREALMHGLTVNSGGQKQACLNWIELANVASNAGMSEESVLCYRKGIGLINSGVNLSPERIFEVHTKLAKQLLLSKQTSEALAEFEKSTDSYRKSCTNVESDICYETILFALELGRHNQEQSHRMFKSIAKVLALQGNPETLEASELAMLACCNENLNNVEAKRLWQASIRRFCSTPKGINRDENARKILHLAIGSRRLDLASSLIQSGLNPKNKKATFETLLGIADRLWTIHAKHEYSIFVKEDTRLLKENKSEFLEKLDMVPSLEMRLALMNVRR